MTESSADANSPDTIEMTLTDLAYGGEALGRHEGLVVFVPNGAPGDRIRGRIRVRKPRFARADIGDMLEPSPDRITPVCPVAEECGGCTWQHLTYAAQLKAKEHFVRGSLHHVGRFRHATIRPILGAPSLFGYRHKLQIPIQDCGEGLVAGFYAPFSHRLVPITECPVQPAIGNRVLRAFLETARELGLSGYREADHVGQIRHLVIRVSRTTREVVAAVVTRENAFPEGGELAAAWQRRVPELVGVLQNVNPERTNVVLGPVWNVLSGQGTLRETIGDVTFRVSAESFFQVHPDQLPALVEIVREAVRPGPGTVVADLYSGVGLFSLPMARQGARLIGVESSAAAVADARANARDTGLDHVEFRQEDAAAGAERLQRAGFRPDAVILDPPRKGCPPALIETLRSWAPGRIAYVSCNPTALARDLAKLCRKTYRLAWVRPVDLFPHTYHVESVAALVRRDAAGAARKGG